MTANQFWLFMSPVDATNLFFSELAREPEMAALVSAFVHDLPGRLDAMNQVAEAGDWQELSCLAHQLKGAAGSYGFPQLALAAAGVEESARDGRPAQDIAVALERLGAACAQTRAGIPLSSSERSHSTAVDVTVDGLRIIYRRS
jgi:histidine phosphotransfer protein HptB